MPLKLNPTTCCLDMVMGPGTGTATVKIAVDDNTAPGTNPVLPTGAGQVTISGSAVAAHSIPIETHSRAANEFNVEVQVGSDVTGAPGNKSACGIVQFDDTAFTVDADGYVQLVGGGGAMISVTTDVAGPVTPSGLGVVDVTGTSVFSDGTVANTLTLNVQSTANTFLIGAGAGTTATEFGPLTDGQLIIGSTGLAPSATTLTATTVANATNATPLFIDIGAGTLNVDLQTGAAITGAPIDKNDAGIVSFDDTMFTVDANGYVQLVGGGLAIDTITGDDAVATPPDGSGNMDLQGLTVANATNAKPLYFNGGTNSQVAEIQVATAVTGAPVDKNDAGIVSFDDTAFSVDANGYVTLVGGAGPAMDQVMVDFNSGTGTNPVLATAAGQITVSGSIVANGTNANFPLAARSRFANTYYLELQVAKARTGSPANKNDVGACSFDDTTFSVDTNGYVTFTGATTDLHDTRFIVSAGGTADGANYTTIASAITAAVAATGVQDIFIQPGVYTEDLTLPENINLVAHDADGYTPTVTIDGKITATSAGSRSISGIRLQTNLDFCLAVTGIAATVVTVSNCYINCTDNTGISFTSSSSSAEIYLINCRGDVGTTGISLFASSSSGTLLLRDNLFENSGASTTASTLSAGLLDVEYTKFNIPITISGTGGFGINQSSIETNSINTTAFTQGGSGSPNEIESSNIASGTASAVVVTSSMSLFNVIIDSGNTGVISGSGTITYCNLIMRGGQSSISTTTQTPKVLVNNLRKVLHPASYPYTVLKSDDIVMVDTSSARTINLPASPETGLRFTIKDDAGSAATNNITISPAAGNIDGAASLAVNINYASVDVVYNGSEWSIL